MRPAVFFDRDGTLNEEVGYLDDISRIALFPWTIEALRLLHRQGLILVVLTNQAGVGRGYFDEPFVDSVHDYLAQRFAAGGAPIDRFYYCPHHPEATLDQYRLNCECRKPNAGMALRAARELEIDLSQSFVVGDRWLDMRVASKVGARGILVRTGYGMHESRHPEPGASAWAIVDHAFAAASLILRSSHA